MLKKRIKKNNSVKKKTRKSRKSKKSAEKKPAEKKSQTIEKKLIENLIALQKVNTNMAEKFDKLSEQIAALLSLFEMTARTFAKQPGIREAEKDKEFLEKIDRLLEQNKTIAKGLTIMEGKVRQRVEAAPAPAPVERRPPAFRPAPGGRTPPRF